MFQPFIVTDLYGQELPGLPTPMLISQGGGEAWQQDEGIWRARDDRHDPPGTKYTRVGIKHVQEFYVDLEVELFDSGNDNAEVEPFRDTVRVVAQNEAEARALAPAACAQYWQDREGDNVSVHSIVIRVKDTP